MSAEQPVFLGDADVARLSDMGDAIAAIEACFLARTGGNFVAPPRHVTSFPGFGRQVYTAGGTTGERPIAGFRVYNDFDKTDAVEDQLVAVWDMRSAGLDGIIVSRHVGSIRTGAIGGVAVKYLSRKNASVAAVIGAGRQAATQIEAAARVRGLAEIRCFNRTEATRTAFAASVQEKLGIPTAAARSAREAVDGADIVIVATRSGTPVIEAEWLVKGAHVNMLGPRLKGNSELGLDVAERAGMIATDSPDQVAALDFFLKETPHMARMIDLADIVSGRVPGRMDDAANSLFCSVGLAGTEVMIAAALIAAARREQA
jgi:ornithine cyclodeaminase/alanine dehydrogenase-like protein (mu-crystallin family)